MILRALAIVALLAGLSACNMPAVPPRDGPGAQASRADPLPPMRRFGPARPSAPLRSNAALAQDFLELSFEMESGRPLPRLTRFSEPVTVGVRGAAPPDLIRDLGELIARLRAEAGIDIRLARAAEDPSITVNVIGLRALRRQQPDAACFILPNISTWEEFLRMRRSRAVDWTLLETRTRAAIFLPGDVAPQEVRDCLHEELAQALGPLNDIYRLPDSVFNDDNFHRVLTGFDMLMLRVHYDDALRNGMSRAQVAARLPAILARLNPRGAGGGGAGPDVTPRAWVDAVKRATGASASRAARRNSAARAVQIARAQGWRDGRAGFSLYVQGRLNLLDDPDVALAALVSAREIYARRSDTALQAADVSIQLAAFALSGGQSDRAIGLVDRAVPAVTRAQNAAALATLLMIKAEALDLQGRTAAAQAVRLDSLGWARYGIGGATAVRAHLREIAALSPAARPGG